MFSKPLTLFFLAALSRAAPLDASEEEFAGALVARQSPTYTPPTTTCTSIPGGKGHSRSYTRTGSCTNTVGTTSTVVTVITTQYTSTSTVETTETDTAATSTDTATETDTDTETATVTGTTTVTTTVGTVTTTTVTSSFPTIPAGAFKREASPVADLEDRAAKVKTVSRPKPSPGNVCVVTRCVRATPAPTTSTSTSVLSESTVTETDTQTTTVTPGASTTVTTTVTTTSTSSITDTETATVTTTSTDTVTYTPVPTFYIQSGGNQVVAAGTDLTDVHTSRNPTGEATGQWSGSGTLFALDNSGNLYDTTNFQYANAGVAGTSGFSPLYFDTEALILSQNYDQCTCAIDAALGLSCTCGPFNEFYDFGKSLYVAGSSGAPGLYSDSPTVNIVAQN